MRRDPDELRQIQANALGRVALIGCEGPHGGLGTWWTLLKNVDFKQAQSVDVWTPVIHGSAEREVALPLSHILVEAVFPVETWDFWNDRLPSRKQKTPSALQNHRVDVAAALPDLSDNMNEAPSALPAALQDVAPEVLGAESDREQLPSNDGSDSEQSSVPTIEQLADRIGLMDSDDDDDDADEPLDISGSAEEVVGTQRFPSLVIIKRQSTFSEIIKLVSLVFFFK